MPDQKGTGKHPHKSTEEPWPHDEARQEEGGREQGRKSESKESKGPKGAQAANRGDQGDLKQREYRDEKGEIHHHTKAYMEQHGGKEEGKTEQRSEGRTRAAGSGGSSQELDEREYRGEKGGTHHHTRSFEKQRKEK